MTKDQFRKMAMSGVETLMTVPQDIWEMTYPVVTLTMREPDGARTRVVVGIEDLGDGKSGDDS